MCRSMLSRLSIVGSKSATFFNNSIAFSLVIVVKSFAAVTSIPCSLLVLKLNKYVREHIEHNKLGYLEIALFANSISKSK